MSPHTLSDALFSRLTPVGEHPLPSVMSAADAELSEFGMSDTASRDGRRFAVSVYVYVPTIAAPVAFLFRVAVIRRCTESGSGGWPLLPSLHAPVDAPVVHVG